MNGVTVKSALVLGAGGFIGSHLVKRLKADGLWVRGVDLKFPRYAETPADDFVIGDLRDPVVCRNVIDRKFDEIVEFSGVEKFLDTPVKRYSSGMRVRLAFAVAALPTARRQH